MEVKYISIKEMKLINIGWFLMFTGIVIMFSNMDNMNNKVDSLFYLYTSPLLIGGGIVIFCRLTGKEEGEW